MKVNILDKINALTSGSVQPQPKKSKPSNAAMKQRIKEVVGGKKKAPPELQAEAEKSLAIIDEFKGLVARPITSPADYAMFDHALGRLTADLKVWEAGVEKILIPMREAKEAVHSLDRATRRPKEDMLLAIRTSMSNWVRQQDALKAQEQLLIDQEASKVRAEADRVKVQAAAAQTAPMRARLESRVANLTAIAEGIEEIESEIQVQADNSHVKRPMKWKVTSFMDIVKAVAAGDLPVDILEVSDKQINFYFKNDREGMKEWPGIEIYEDVQIVGGKVWRGNE